MTGLKLKITAFLCLWLCAIPFLYSGFFFLKQYHIRHEMEEKLEEQFLQIITIHKKDVHWVEEEKELRINGHLFDVESIKLKGDSVQLSGLYDEEEDLIFLALERMQKKGKDHASSLVEKAFNFVFIHPDAETTVADQPNEILSVVCFFHELIPTISLPIHSPPPKS